MLYSIETNLCHYLLWFACNNPLNKKRDVMSVCVCVCV